MYIQELWRYPAKSMRGERLSQAVIERTGIRGDRSIVVVSGDGKRVITARTHPRLLGLQGSISAKGETMIEEWPWYSPEALALTRQAVGERVQLVDAGLHPERFDVLPLLIATDGAVESLELDRRRLRPNIVVGGVPGLDERTWPGKRLRSGKVLIDVAQLRMRCVMTTVDPETLARDAGVLRRIVRKAGGKLALDCSVELPGSLRVEDPIELVA